MRVNVQAASTTLSGVVRKSSRVIFDGDRGGEPSTLVSRRRGAICDAVRVNDTATTATAASAASSRRPASPISHGLLYNSIVYRTP